MKFLLGVFAIGALIGVTALARKKRTDVTEEPKITNGAGTAPVKDAPPAHTPTVAHG